MQSAHNRAHNRAGELSYCGRAVVRYTRAGTRSRSDLSRSPSRSTGQRERELVEQREHPGRIALQSLHPQRTHNPHTRNIATGSGDRELVQVNASGSKSGTSSRSDLFGAHAAQLRRFSFAPNAS